MRFQHDFITLGVRNCVMQPLLGTLDQIASDYDHIMIMHSSSNSNFIHLCCSRITVGLFLLSCRLYFIGRWLNKQNHSFEMTELLVDLCRTSESGCHTSQQDSCSSNSPCLCEPITETHSEVFFQQPFYLWVFCLSEWCHRHFPLVQVASMLESVVISPLGLPHLWSNSSTFPVFVDGKGKTLHTYFHWVTFFVGDCSV